MKKKILIITSIIVLLIIALWFTGIIPKQIGKICGIKYMKENFPKMELEYKRIEWNRFYGDYIISFEDIENQTYGCVIGPKYLPVNIGQGINRIQETYKEKYVLNSTEPHVPEIIDTPNENKNKMQENEKEYNRSAKNVTIEVLEHTITNKSLEIVITDNNEDYFGWGVDFKVQKKVDLGWEYLQPASDDLIWNAIAYLPNEDDKIKQKLDIENYYGKLKKGTYRIVKSVYDKENIEIYSNEFEIK